MMQSPSRLWLALHAYLHLVNTYQPMTSHNARPAQGALFASRHDEIRARYTVSTAPYHYTPLDVAIPAPATFDVHR